MARTRSISSIARFARVAAVSAAGLVAAVALRGERADACGGGDWLGIEEATTFDPQVIGEWEGLAFNPYSAGFGGKCDSCIETATLADWTAYLPGVTADDWKKVLHGATEADLVSLRARAAGKSTQAPKGFETSSLWKVAAKDRVVAAIDFVRLARQVEPFASFEMYDADGNQRTPQPPPIALVNAARDGMKASKDPFLVQRYAFQAMRVAFYQREWSAVAAFFDRNQIALAGPSQDLAWRARHYLAGALKRNGLKARANYELAHIGTNYKPLSGLAAQEFQPMEDTDWRETLRYAKTVHEKAELWQLVGITKDGIVATQEILKLEPKSNLIGILVVRELAKAESKVAELWGKPEPKEIAAQKKMYAQLEQIALGQLARGGDKPWLMELVAGHIAAKRGDLAAARSRLARAVAGKPNDVKVASQAKASLALALATSWKLDDGAAETELAAAMASIDPTFGRASAVRDEVRGKLAKVFYSGGKLIDAEFLKAGTVDPIDWDTGKPVNKGKPHWQQVPFLEDLIARANKQTTPFDQFVVKDGFKVEHLQLELGLRHLLDGDFTAAQKLFKTTKAEKWGTDPFVIHIRDCHDCDHARYEKAKWDHLNVTDKLVELDAKVKLGGEVGADAAMQIGNVLYNLTYWGNARVATAETHQKTEDASLAMKYYKKAFDLSKNRELKAKAAFLAAKAELGNLMGADTTPAQVNRGLPVPTTWFPVLKQYANTRYYREVLKECGHFATWASP